MQDTPTILHWPEQSLCQARQAVARVLLEHAGENATGSRQRLSQRDMAALTGADWKTVHMSLRSLQAEEAIRIDRNRIIINRERLERVAGDRLAATK